MPEATLYTYLSVSIYIYSRGCGWEGIAKGSARSRVSILLTDPII